MLQSLLQRESGLTTPAAVAARTIAQRVQSIDISSRKEVVSAHKAAINSLQVDLVEGRYLLAGVGDGTVGIYDVLEASRGSRGGALERHEALAAVEKGSPHAHKFSVSSVLWYPVDTGLFVTGSADKSIHVWDTNTLQGGREGDDGT
eukprot:jgi/Mesen1/249/ME1143529C07582